MRAARLSQKAPSSRYDQRYNLRAFDSRQRSLGVYSMMTLPKSGWPVRGHTEVNSVAVKVTAWISGAGKASALRYSRASPGVDGRGSGPVRGSLGFCSFID